MQLGKLVEVCHAGIPQSSTWRGTAGEQYGGPFGVSDMDKDIRRVLYSVTHSVGVEHYAMLNAYDLTISHHPATSWRLPHLVYHTALDCCEGGLNDMWAAAIGMTTHNHFDENLGAVGRIAPTSILNLVESCRKFSGDIIGALKSDGQPIQSVVICTGLGGMVLDTVESWGPDCYITGQLIHDPRHSSIPNVIEIGHTLSERCGITMFEKLLRPHGVTVDSVPLSMDVFGGETYFGNSVRHKMNTVQPMWKTQGA